jgi:hypothetical protein
MKMSNLIILILSPELYLSVIRTRQFFKKQLTHQFCYLIIKILTMNVTTYMRLSLSLLLFTLLFSYTWKLIKP